MERCLGAGGFPSGAATLDLPVASAVAATTAGVRHRSSRNYFFFLLLLKHAPI